MDERMNEYDREFARPQQEYPVQPVAPQPAAPQPSQPQVPAVPTPSAPAQQYRTQAQPVPQPQQQPQQRVQPQRQPVPAPQPQPQQPAQAPQYRPQQPTQPQPRPQQPVQQQPAQAPQYRPQQPVQSQQPAQPQPRQPQATAGAHASRPQTRAAAAAPTQTSPSRGVLKTFLAGFAGAALACLILLGATGNLLPAAPTSGNVTLGGAEGTTFTVAGDDATLAEAVASKTLPSVGCIYVYSESTGYGMFGGMSSGEQLSSLGSGVVLTEDGYMLTNEHVIAGESRLQVSLNDSQYSAQVVGTDATSDLAVIKLEDASGLTPIEVGTSQDLQVGQWVMTVGSPYGMEQSVATGIISAVSRSSVSLQDAEGGAIYANLIQTDAAINPGNSGGALVDANGRLIGINTLVASYSGSYSGVGFAIPVDYAVSIGQQIINGETPSHAQLGVSLVSIDADTARRYGLPVEAGAYVATAYAGAAEAGIQEGDIIVKVNGKDVSSATDVILEVRSRKPGDTLPVTLNHNGETVDLEVTLTSDADK